MPTKRGGLEASLIAALKAAPVLPMDDAAIALARSYASALDARPDMLGQLGRGLKELLIEFGMTPRARAALLKEMGDAPPKESGLDELRARRERRVSR